MYDAINITSVNHDTLNNIDITKNNYFDNIIYNSLYDNDYYFYPFFLNLSYKNNISEQLCYPIETFSK
ncbi:hypothetical protein [Clostridium pasteurianum]|uniref:Uncharacterized protein n=1 Tax=Clostridium pasteurianum BC1 TaxID=86416 RepID=R4K3U0_CLOPA|nr:hypothetical protein [Clostridium pasteurianum]AGK97248.1 hypothetical protein Clopa_2385 [Clostridium pasteurianum BC1]